jgi:hypothetical protein
MLLTTGRLFQLYLLTMTSFSVIVLLRVVSCERINGNNNTLETKSPLTVTGYGLQKI